MVSRLCFLHALWGERHVRLWKTIGFWKRVAWIAGEFVELCEKPNIHHVFHRDKITHNILAIESLIKTVPSKCVHTRWELMQLFQLFL